MRWVTTAILPLSDPGPAASKSPYPSPPCWRNHRTENAPSNISPHAARSRSPSSNAMVFAAFHVGKIAGTVAGGWWLAAQDAARVAARARRLAGISPDLASRHRSDVGGEAQHG